MPDRSELGDLIVEHGMFVEGLTRPPKLARALDNVPHLAELRDELIRLRRMEDACNRTHAVHLGHQAGIFAREGM